MKNLKVFEKPYKRTDVQTFSKNFKTLLKKA